MTRHQLFKSGYYLAHSMWNDGASIEKMLERLATIDCAVCVEGYSLFLDGVRA